jgi:hypothetical protein
MTDSETIMPSTAVLVSKHGILGQASNDKFMDRERKIKKKIYIIIIYFSSKKLITRIKCFMKSSH